MPCNGEVENGKTSVTEANRVLDVSLSKGVTPVSAIVRPAVSETVRHGCHIIDMGTR
jgi:hypothetical protein